jgi:hypothetical protein
MRSWTRPAAPANDEPAGGTYQDTAWTVSYYNTQKPYVLPEAGRNGERMSEGEQPQMARAAPIEQVREQGGNYIQTEHQMATRNPDLRTRVC